MPFDYKSHYIKLISEFTDVLIQSIEKMPEADKILSPENTENITEYRRKESEQEPLSFD